MSLKGFHIVFVFVSTLLCLFLALWSFVFSSEISGIATTLGIVGVLGAFIMSVYGICFYRKINGINL